MKDLAGPARVIRFGIFEMDFRAGELHRSGVKVKLQEQPFQVLAMLLEHPGDLVTREELQKRLWSTDTFVDFDHGVNTAINKIREALGDSADNPRFVETLARRGYRFIAPVVGATLGVAQGEAAPRPYKVLALVVGILVAALAVLFALNVAGLRERLVSYVGARHGVPLPKIESIAVLPLENLSHDPEQEYFADGMTDELITDLGKISALRVISRTSVMRYKQTKKPLPDIARELNVDAVVEGTVLRSGDRVRVTANLLHAPTDRHLWAESYERNLGDVLALQGEVARAIAEEVRIKLTPEEHVRLTTTRPVNPEAYEALLRGRFYSSKGTNEGLRKSLEYFQKAVEKDPGYAEAYAWLAMTHVSMGYPGLVAPHEALQKAKAAATKAIELDDTLAEAHAALGQIKFSYEWDWSGAEREFKRAIEADPSGQRAHGWYTVYLSCMGRSDDAIAEAKTAFQLEPLSRIGLVHAYTLARRYEESNRELQKELEIFPASAVAHYWLNANYVLQGRYAEAISECQKIRELEPGPYSAMVCAWTYAFAGRRNAAQRELRDYLNAPYVDPWSVAEIHSGLGEKEKSIQWLRKAYEERSANICLLKVNPCFDSLHSDPRFQNLLRRMNFPP